MSDTLTDAQHDWVRNVLEVDPRSYGAAGAAASGESGAAASGEAGAASSGEAGLFDSLGKKIVYAATTVENAVGDIWSDVKIGAEKAEQTVEGLVDAAGEKLTDLADSARKAAGPAAPPPTVPARPITLTSVTEVSTPGNRARTKLGVGEKVTLKVVPGPGAWHASGATLSARSGSTVTMTAPPRPGTVEITVEVAGVSKSLKFTVVAPSTVVQERLSTEHLSNGLPNAGFHAQVYLGPDDVNFNACSFIEDEIGAKASGSWSEKNGEGHSPNKSPISSTSAVVPGKGTRSRAVDHCWSGYVPGLSLTDWTGESTLSIPWHWQCGSGKGLIARVTQRVVTTRDGTTTISKAGASFTAALS